MDCGFYIIYINPDKKITKEISRFWEEQRRLSNLIRNTYDQETEYKYLKKYTEKLYKDPCNKN